MEKIPKIYFSLGRIWLSNSIALFNWFSSSPVSLFFKHMDKGCIFKMIFVKVGYSLGGKADLDGSAVFSLCARSYKLVGTEGID